MSKKIWLLGIGKDCDIGTGKIYAHRFNYDVAGFEPVREIPESVIHGKPTMRLLYYLPEGYNSVLQGYTSFDIMYTDKEEMVRAKWFQGTISNFEHIKDLEYHGLAVIAEFVKIEFVEHLNNAEKHRNEFPEFWM